MVTNLHVVGQGDRVTVRVNDSKTLSAVFLGYDALRDLAVLRVCCDGSLQASPLSVRRVSPGESVFAMGYPLGIDQASVTSGIVSRVTYDRMSERWMVQTDAPINPGNSGGPLFTLDGEIVGINTSVVRESSTGRAVEGFGFAVSARTVLQVLPSLKAGTIGPPPRPTATPAPTPRPRTRFGPVDGSLEHDNDGFIEEFRAGLALDEFAAVVTFQNPSRGPGRNWDHGFLFNITENDHFDILLVTGESRWYHYRRQGSVENERLLDSGGLAGLNVGPGQSNEVRLIALGLSGFFFLNGKLVSTLDLSDPQTPGDVSIITGYFAGHEIPGHSTPFQGFRVSAPLFVGDETGQLDYDSDDQIDSFSMVTNVEDFITAVTFTNPYSPSVGRWSYGLAFRHSGWNQFQAVTVSSDGWWEHFVRQGTVASVHEQSGRTPLNLASNGTNRLLLLAVERVGLFSVNGTFVAELDLGLSSGSGDIWAGGELLRGGRSPWV